MPNCHIYKRCFRTKTLKCQVFALWDADREAFQLCCRLNPPNPGVMSSELVRTANQEQGLKLIKDRLISLGKKRVLTYQVRLTEFFTVAAACLATSCW